MLNAPPRVLHVEDNDFFAKVTAGVLDDEYGIRVQTVDGAEAALERLERETFDCIVSDYEMPGMDGLELLDAVRESFPEIPFILLTGGGSERIASKAISAGVTDYIRKGVGKEQFTVLANRIENAIARRRAERLANRLIAVNDHIWDASQAVLRATSREAIAETLCERLTTASPYLLSWVGKYDEETDAVRPQAAAGIDVGCLEPVALAGDGDDGHGDASIREAVASAEIRVERPVEPTPALERASDLDADYYAGAVIPLVYEDRPYGVLVVWSDDRRAFGETERQILSKFGEAVAYAVDSVRTRKELVRREQRLQVFNRILRHNLRNDLNVVLGHAENIGDEHPDAEREAGIIRRKANELIEISEKAREVGKTLDADDRTRRQIDLTTCVERTCAEFRQTYPDADVTADLPDAVTVYADKTLEAAIGEVLENAIEHNDRARPTVTLSVSAAGGNDEWVELTVADDGPGIPEEERTVLVEGEETALHHGSGLGLWLANWIVGKFGGELRFGTGETGVEAEAATGEAHHDAGDADETPASGGVVTLRLQRADAAS